jgi:hypothetical protein
MSAYPPHEFAVFQAISDAMKMERAERVDYVFPVEGGRIVMEAVFIPNHPDTIAGPRLLPDPPRVDRRRRA